MRLKQQSGIYKLIIEKETGINYYYIGQSKNISNRVKQHKYLLKNNKHYNKHLQAVYNKYRSLEVECLTYCDIEELDTLEQMYLDNSDNWCVNQMPVIKKGHGVPQKVRNKISESLRVSPLKKEGETHHKTTLTEQKVKEIYYSDRPTKDLIIEYSVSKHTINRIRSGKTWKHLNLPVRQLEKFIPSPICKLTKKEYECIMSYDHSISSKQIAKDFKMDHSYICKLRSGKYKPKSFKPS